MLKTAKIVIFILSLNSLFIILNSPAHADYNSAYQDYTFNYQNYRNAYNAFQIAKSSFKTYNTVTSQNDAISKFRVVLKSRDQLMVVYYNLLQEKMNATNGVSGEAKNTFNSIKQSESSWLSTNQQKIDAAGSLDDLNSVSAEFEQRYPQMDTEAKQTINTIESGKLTNFKSQLDNSLSQLNNKLGQIRSDGTDTSVWDRDIILSQNQLDLYNQKLSDANAVFNPQNFYSNQLIDLYQGQKTLVEAKQYLRETVNSLLQIIKQITG